VSAPEPVIALNIWRLQNGYLIQVSHPVGGGSWAFRTLPDALEQAGRLLEPPAAVAEAAGAAS
jgi:hypothetical protein